MAQRGGQIASSPTGQCLQQMSPMGPSFQQPAQQPMQQQHQSSGLGQWATDDPSAHLQASYGTHLSHKRLNPSVPPDNFDGENPMQHRRSHGVQSSRRSSITVGAGLQEAQQYTVIQKVCELFGCIKTRDELNDIRCPDNVSVELWKHILIEYGNDKQWIEDFARFANVKQPPSGFYDAALWGHMSDSMKERFLRVENKARRGGGLDSIYSSQVCKFFCDCTSADFNFDSSVNAFALLNALILAVPYSVILNLDASHWSDMTEAFHACPAGSMIDNAITAAGGIDEFIKGIYQLLVLNLSVGVYMGITGLVLCTLFYVFKTNDPSLMSKWRIRKIRIILFLILICTFCAVSAIVFIYGNLLQFYAVPPSYVCDSGEEIQKAYRFGLAITGLGLVAGFYLMS